MPPKKSEKKAAVPESDEASSLTQENFEKELRGLKAKARTQTTFRQVMTQVAVVTAALRVLAYAAAYSNVSQYTLSPIYGAIPSSIYHSKLVMTMCFLGWSSNLYLKRILPKDYKSPGYFIVAVAFYIPLLQLMLFKLSGSFGAIYGPIITESLTFGPLLFLSAANVAEILEDLDLGNRFPSYIGDALPGMVSWGVFRTCETFFDGYLREVIGANFFVSRLGFQFILNGLYATMAPSKVILFALPGLFHTVFSNPHVQSPWTSWDLNTALKKHDYRLLDRQDSLTGYLSVIENTKDNFRVMRCDHSLLGGEWLPVEGASGNTVHEPIYGVFAMLEAVRLVEVKTSSPGYEESALVVGLGIGTTPSALIAHGINTTIVEIDPVVFKYASQYFNLPAKHNPVIADAVSYAAEIAEKKQASFDYIVHDVFTGGAEPVDLFTKEFFQDLHSVLKPSGVVAINYAGDLLLPSARLVIRTIKSVFPSCRVYRENATPSVETLSNEARDFTNMVIFCTNEADEITFRKPVALDYLGSRARKEFLVPKHEIKASYFEEQEGDGDVLSRNDTSRLTKWQQTSAVGHWNVMRTVLPDYIWEGW